MAKGTQKVKLKEEIDFSGLENFKKNIQKLNNNHIEWGWLNRKVYPTKDINDRGGQNIAEVAFLNEHGFIVSSSDAGLVESPPRPYFKQSLGLAQSSAIDISKLVFTSLHKTDKETTTNLHKSAIEIKKTLTGSIMKQNMAPLADKTVMMKGHEFQWDDTAIMLENIESKVIKGKIDKVKND